MAYGTRGGGAMTQDLGGLERELSSRLELEHTVLEARAQELRREARKQARQRAFLREERKSRAVWNQIPGVPRHRRDVPP